MFIYRKKDVFFYVITKICLPLRFVKVKILIEYGNI